MKSKKKVLLVHVLDLIKEGKNPTQISKFYSIPKQNINYFVGKLKKLGCIEKVGYGTWKYLKPLKQVKIRPKGSIAGQSFTSHKLKEIRGHAYIWKIEFLEGFDWEKIVRHYKKNKLKFTLICNKKVPRTIFNHRKIWLTKRGLTIYEPLDFFGKSSFEVKGTAVFEMDQLVKGLLKELGVKFKVYRFTTSREHYGMIKNELARQYNDKKEKLHVKSEDGNVWLWIDDSKGLGELETAEPNISRQVQNYWNNHKKHKFQVDADFVLKGMANQSDAIKKNAEHLEFHAENMRSHVKAVQDLGTGVREFSEKSTLAFDKLTNLIEEMQKSNKTKTL